MNKVKQRTENPAYAKVLYASKVMYLELKLIKIFLYILNIIPIVIVFLPSSEENVKIMCSLISFGLTLFAEVSSQMVSDYKEKTIIEHQLYEALITGSSFSKIEYDRESTNDVQERAIRKGLPVFNKKRARRYQPPYVPEDISDDYTYLYIARQSAAKIRFLLSREFIFYIILLFVIGAAFVTFTSLDGSIKFEFYYVICLWPMIVPLIRNTVACQKCVKQCVKISADIDNFFADGDDTIERLARFYYYVQNIEFEMLLVKPTVFMFIEKLYSHPLKILQQGVTDRFKEAVQELKSKKYIKQPKGKSLITSKDYDLDELIEKAKQKKLKEKENHLKENIYHAPKKDPVGRTESVLNKEVNSVELKKKNTSTIKVTKKKQPTPSKKKTNSNKKAKK